MTIELPTEAQQFIKQQLDSGHYADESEVVAHALTFWQDYQKRSADIHASVQRGLDDAAANRGTLISTPAEAEAFKQKTIERANKPTS